MVFKIQKIKNKKLYRVLNTLTKDIIITTSSKQQALKIKNILNKKQKKSVIKKSKKKQQTTKLTGQIQKLNDLLNKSQSGEYGSFDLPRKQGEFITRIINKEPDSQQQVEPVITKLTVLDLKRLARERGIKGFNKLKKQELINVLQPPTQPQPSAPPPTQQPQQIIALPQQTQSASAIDRFNIATGQTKQETIDALTTLLSAPRPPPQIETDEEMNDNIKKFLPTKRPKKKKLKIITRDVPDLDTEEELQQSEPLPPTPLIKRIPSATTSTDLTQTQPITTQESTLISPPPKKRGRPPKQQPDELKASGLLDSVTGYVSNLLNKEQYSLPVKSILERLGGKKIIAMNIIRTPINKNINRALDVISLGKWSQLKNEFNYDNMFHLALVVKLDDMTNLLIEKNERINVDTSFKYLPTTQIKHVNISGKSITLNDLMNNGNKLVGNNDWFVYSAFKNNCQAFIKAVLQGNNLYTSDINNFVYQDMTEIKKQLPRNVVPTANFITDLGSLVSRLRGRGIC